jgi:hypothetical protein
MARTIEVGNHPVSLSGKLFRVGRLRDEFYDFLQDPADFIEKMRPLRECDVFSFIQEVPDQQPAFRYFMEKERLAVLRISTYEHWWTKQVNDKVRNMVRKGPKAGIEVRSSLLDDELIAGITRICNETPLRQGRRFKHYGKAPEQVRQEHASFPERSEFFGAYLRGELVGYIKLVHGRGVSNLMQILAMTAHRDKAPTNLLLAKAIESCAARQVPLLQYGVWSRRSMGDFKKKNGFELWEVPRYYVPLTFAGQLQLRLRLHRSLAQILPEEWVDQCARIRGQWNQFRLASREKQAPIAS